MEPAKITVGEKTEFMSCLADDLAHGTVELPSFPEVVTKVRKALADENSTTDDLVRIIATEPVLAARVLTIANSAAMRTGGDPVTSLNVAVNRIGRKLVRSTAMAFAIDRLRSGHKLDSVRKQLKALWQRSVHVSSLCYVVARNFTSLDPDEALFIGLMHGIGELYILVRADERPDLFRDEDELKAASGQWGATIGSLIVDGWGFARGISDAIAHGGNPRRSHDGPIDYADVLIIACVLFEFATSGDAEPRVEQVPAWRQLELETSVLVDVLRKSDELILSLCRALG